MKIRAKTDLSKINQALERLGHKGKFFHVVGQLMIASIEKNFAAEGRPQRWQPLAWATLTGRYKGNQAGGSGGFSTGFTKMLQGHRILVRRGYLKNSIWFKPDDNRVEVGTNVKYAKIQHYGGQAGRGHKVHIPARPFVLVQDEDRTSIREKFRQWVLA